LSRTQLEDDFILRPDIDPANHAIKTLNTSSTHIRLNEWHPGSLAPAWVPLRQPVLIEVVTTRTNQDTHRVRKDRNSQNQRAKDPTNVRTTKNPAGWVPRRNPVRPRSVSPI